MSPAVSRRQLKAAYAAKGRGEKWGKEMVGKTPRATRSKLMTQGSRKAKAK